MTVEVLYFAWLRERIGHPRETVQTEAATPRALIAETIDLVAVLSGRGSARRLAELARVDGLAAGTDYRLSPATQPPDPQGDPA